MTFSNNLPAIEVISATLGDFAVFEMGADLRGFDDGTDSCVGWR